MAERSLFLWNNEYIVSLVAQHREMVLPLIFGALERNTTHWNPAVMGLTMNVRKMLVEMDGPLVDECKRRYEEEAALIEQSEKERKKNWKRIEEAAAAGVKA